MQVWIEEYYNLLFERWESMLNLEQHLGLRCDRFTAERRDARLESHPAGRVFVSVKSYLAVYLEAFRKRTLSFPSIMELGAGL